MKSIVSKIYASSLSESLSDEITSDNSGMFNISGDNAVGDLASKIVSIALPLAGIATVVLLVVAGYKMISSQGNPEKLKDAKEMITNAIIGLVFILLSVSILLLISNIFQLNIGGV
jgi:hypothetical protein